LFSVIPAQAGIHSCFWIPAFAGMTNKLVAFLQSTLIFDVFYYSRLIASTGQVSTQIPQSMHNSLSTWAFSSTILIASLGHSGTHDSQPVHLSLFTFAGISRTLSKKNNNWFDNLTTFADKKGNITKL
jgi:hypothetical protein